MKKSIILTSVVLFALVAASFTVSAQVPSAQNYLFNSDLTLGSSGLDVVALQSWLINNGYSIPSVSSGMTAKGYFGEQTRGALISYQRSIGLPAYGFFGPMTRQYFNRSDNNNNNAASFRITSPNGGESWQIGTSHNITWTSPYFFRATYVDIKLQPSNACTSGTYCTMLYRMPYTIATGIPINQNSYSWNVGNVQSFTPPVVAGGAVPYPSTPITPAGQYTIQICQTGTSVCTSSQSTFTIYSNGQTNSQPVISGIDAPVTLSVGQSGTWTVHATDPMNGTLSYSVLWGDEQNYAYTTSGAMASPQVMQTTTFTHSYANAGVYTVTFTVRNSSGLQAQTTSTVTIGVSSNSSVPDINIVSPNGGGAWLIGTNQTIQVNLTGDPTRIGNTVTAYLVDTNNQQVYVGSFAQGSGAGYRTFNATVPTNISAGSYRLLVNLYNASQQQAYDYSDGFFTVTNSDSYIYPRI